MSISFACSCGTMLRAPDDATGKTVICPKCKSRLKVPTPEPASIDEVTDVEAESGSLPSKYSEENKLKNFSNIFQRYKHWAGTRSIIFQSLLAGWTAFAFLATLGLLVAAVAKNPESRHDENAQTAAVGLYSCCGCGGYFLIAFPLGISAVATLDRARIRVDKDQP